MKTESGSVASSVAGTELLRRLYQTQSMTFAPVVVAAGLINLPYNTTRREVRATPTIRLILELVYRPYEIHKLASLKFLVLRDFRANHDIASRFNNSLVEISIAIHVQLWKRVSCN